MARFRCPSVSSTASRSRSVTPLPGPSEAPKEDDRETPQPEPIVKRDKGRARHPVIKMDDADRARVRAKKELIHARTKTNVMSHLFVGNLNSAITNSDLEEVFSRIGEVVRVQIRTLCGAFCPSGKGVGLSLYATVEFRKPVIVRRALRLNGTDVKGIKLLVAKDVVELNEFNNALQQRHPRKKSLFSTGWMKIKQLTIERTERIDDQPEPVKKFPLAE